MGLRERRAVGGVKGRQLGRTVLVVGTKNLAVVDDRRRARPVLAVAPVFLRFVDAQFVAVLVLRVAALPHDLALEIVGVQEKVLRVPVKAVNPLAVGGWR